ncbi:MAG: RNA 2'-phosphotransferase [Acidobacteriota bacterium]
MQPELKSISKFLSLVLRHDPQRIGLTMDDAGWVRVDELLQQAAAHGQEIDGATLDEVVGTNDKKRFAFSADGTRIRASQGHSVAVDLGLEPLAPPPELFHGTATRFLESILSEGLDGRARTHVHLSADVEVAVQVGQRHGRPVVLSVAARAMAIEGFDFYRSENGVWLTRAVPPRFLTTLDR